MIAAAARPGGTVFERHARATVAFLLLSAVLLTDLGFTWLYQRFGDRLVTPPPRFRVRSEVYHHGFAPLVSVDRERWGAWVAPYHIDSLGFRDASAREVPLTSTRRRLLFIGDSFTEGVGVAYENTFVGRIGTALASRQVEVLNAGVASYCPIIDYRKARYLLEDVGLRVDEVVVYVDIGDIEDEVTYKLDEHGNVVGRERRRLQEQRADREHDIRLLGGFHRLERFLRLHTLLLGSGYDTLEMLLERPLHRAGLWTVDPGLFEAYGREGLAQAEAHMDLLAAFLRERGVGLTVAVYPWPDQIRLGDRDSRQSRFWRDWCARRGAAFVDHFPSLVGVGPPEDVIRRDYIGGDIHWNEAGHEVIARGFLDQHEGASRGGRPPGPD